MCAAARLGVYQGELATGQQSGTWATFFSVEGIRDDGWRQFSPATIRRGYADIGAKDDKTEVHLNFYCSRQFRWSDDGGAGAAS